MAELTATGVKVLARVTGNWSCDRSGPGRRLVYREDLQEWLRPGEGPRRDRGPGDPLHAGRPAAGRARRGTCPDDEPLRRAARSGEELIVLYHERWEEELVFDEQKTHQDPRRATKPAQLRSETPEGVIQEVYAVSLAHFVIRSLMFEAAATVGLDPDGCRSPDVSRS